MFVRCGTWVTSKFADVKTAHTLADGIKLLGSAPPPGTPARNRLTTLIAIFCMSWAGRRDRSCDRRAADGYKTNPAFVSGAGGLVSTEGDYMRCDDVVAQRVHPGEAVRRCLNGWRVNGSCFLGSILNLHPELPDLEAHERR